MLSLFDSPAQEEAAPRPAAGEEEEQQQQEEVSHAGQSDAP
jgi:hypothetical protein